MLPQGLRLILSWLLAQCLTICYIFFVCFPHHRLSILMVGAVPTSLILPGPNAVISPRWGEHSVPLPPALSHLVPILYLLSPPHLLGCKGQQGQGECWVQRPLTPSSKACTIGRDAQSQGSPTRTGLRVARRASLSIDASITCVSDSGGGAGPGTTL